jgi:3'(2'), 5'-bisphosphate nucleotidase
MGVVHAPVRNVSYFAERGQGAWRQRGDSNSETIHSEAVPPSRIRVVASKDHAGPEVAAILDRWPGAELKQIGSSLKFCMVAEGAADLYPRLGPTMEWDTAAAQCIVEAAGGVVLILNGEPLGYGKAGRKNLPFFVAGGEEVARRLWLPLFRGVGAS